MLTVSPEATAAVDAVMESNGLPEEAGLRLALGEQTDQGTPIVLSVAEEPQAGDEIVTTGGVHDVYLDPGAAEILDDQELHAQVAEEEVAFSLVPQGSTDGKVDDGTF